MENNCPCECDKLPRFTGEQAHQVISFMAVTTKPEPLAWPQGPEHLYETLAEGMNVELEHCDVTHGDTLMTAKIALAHLREDPEYYQKLKKAGL